MYPHGRRWIAAAPGGGSVDDRIDSVNVHVAGISVNFASRLRPWTEAQSLDGQDEPACNRSAWRVPDFLHFQLRTAGRADQSLTVDYCLKAAAFDQGTDAATENGEEKPGPERTVIRMPAIVPQGESGIP
jgi:hypothetical protein